MRSILSLIFIFSTVVVLAQVDKKLQSGIDAFQASEFQKAYKLFTEVIESSGEAPKPIVAKAYYHRGKTRMGLIMEAYKSQDESKIKDAKGMPLDAYKDYKKAKEYDEAKEMEALIDIEMMQLYGSFKQSTMGIVNVAQQQMGEAQIMTANTALEYCEMLIDMKPEAFIPYDLRGQAKLIKTQAGKGSASDAKADFEKALNLYQKSPPEVPDMMVGYTYYRLALIALEFESSAKAALATAKQGQAFIDKERERLSGESDANQQAKELYGKARKDLTAISLNAYLQLPELRDEAIDAYESALKKYPGEYAFHVGHAKLWEKVDPNKAAESYKQATKLDATEATAWYGLGVVYLNQAADISKKIATTDDMDEKAKLDAEAKSMLKRALEPLQKAHEIEEDNINTLKALVQVTKALEMNEEYKAYEEKLAKL